jgi:hypothetical protein
MSKNALEGPDRKKVARVKNGAHTLSPSLSNLKSHSLFTVCKQFHGSRANIHLSNPFILVFGGPEFHLFYFPSSKGGHAIFFCLSQVCNFLRLANPQIANPQICTDLSENRKSANFLGVPIRKSQVRKFAR